MSSDLHFQIQEELEAELGREPTDEEMEQAYRDCVASLIDQAKELRKYGDM